MSSYRDMLTKAFPDLQSGIGDNPPEGGTPAPIQDTPPDDDYSVSEVEREYCFYAQIGDFSQLCALASGVLDQEQWNFPSNGKGTLRMRKEVPIKLNWDAGVAEPIGEVKFTQTIKRYLDAQYTGVSNAQETTFTVDEATFKEFSLISESGMVKRRFLIPIQLTQEEKATLEVDVFFDSEGHYQPWAKIDLETKLVIKSIPKFPFAVDNVIPPTADKETRDQIMNTYFLTRR